MECTSRYRLILTFFALFFALVASASPLGTTYQARIIKPDGQALESASVNFKFTILDPAGTCILYAETFSAISMTNSSGIISFSLGSGVKNYPASSTIFAQVFNNSTPSLSCDAGGPVSYSPAATDIRKIVMQFNDGSGWQTLPAMAINAVPYAIYSNDSMSLGGVSATNYVQYSTIPSCAVSEALRYNGTNFSCISVASGGGASGTITSGDVTAALGYTPADQSSVATSFTTVTNSLSTVGTSFTTVTSTINSLGSSVTAIASTVNSLSASMAALTSSQWSSSGSNIYYNSGNVGIGTTTPVTKLDVSGGVRIGAESTTCAPALAGTLRYNASNVEYCNGTSWQAFGVSGAGITNLNGSTSGTQTFATGTGGTAPGFNTSNGVHTLNIPNASTGSVTAGLISNADYTTFTNKITSSAASIAQVLGYVPADNAASGTYAQKANNLSDLTNIATARTNLGLGTFATASSIDLGSASATGTLAIARLPSFSGDATVAAASNTIILSNSGATAGTYTKVTVDSKGRVTSSSALASSDITAALGYTPANSATSVSSQWTTSGTTINYTNGKVGIGTTNPQAALTVSGSIATGNASTTATGSYAVALGEDNHATGNNSVAMGGSNTATNGYSTAIGWGNTVSGNSAVALGFDNKATGFASFAVGDTSIANQYGAIAMGVGSEARAYASIAMGEFAVASGTNAFSVGLGNVAEGDNSVAFGNYSLAQGYNSMAMGESAQAYNQYAISLGTSTIASGFNSVAIGQSAVAHSYSQITLGRNNMPKGGESPNSWVATDPLFVVGNGLGTGAARSSALMLLKNGNLGVGVLSPTAKLHLAAGTSATAFFKLSSGTLLTSPQAGAVEYDGVNLYYTDETNARRTIAATTGAGAYTGVTSIESGSNITLVPTGSVVVSATTSSTNPQTGALIVKGGLGVAENISVGGNVNVSGSLNVSGTVTGSTDLVPASAILLMQSCPVGWTDTGATGGGPGLATCNGVGCRLCQTASAALVPPATKILMESCPSGWVNMGKDSGPGSAGYTVNGFIVPMLTCQSPATSSNVPKGLRFMMPSCPASWSDVGVAGSGPSTVNCPGSLCRVCEVPGGTTNQTILFSGDASGTTAGGPDAYVLAGKGGSTSGNGGSVSIRAGAATDGWGGNVTLVGGSASSTTNGTQGGGSISVLGGNTTTSGAGGAVYVGGGYSSYTGTNMYSDVYLSSGGGNVGVGSASATKLLHVQRDQNSDTAVLVRNAGIGTSAMSAVDLESDINGIQLVSYGSAMSGNWGGSTIPKANSAVLRTYTTLPVSNMGVGTGSAAPLHLITSDVPRLTVTSTGNVGIGTASPSVPLEVAGNVKISGQIVNPAWTAVATFSNSWTANYPIAGVAAPGYRKGADGRVYLRGCMAPGSWSTTAFTLPAGYVPSSNLTVTLTAYSSAAANAVAAYAWVYTDGTFNPWLGNSASWICMDGISYPTD